MTRDREDGTGAYYLETYWAFDEDGPIQLNTGIIQQELAKLLPPDHGVWKGYGLNLKALCYRMPIWKKGDANASPTGGAVALKLTIENHLLTIVSKKFDPNGPVEPRNASCEP